MTTASPPKSNPFVLKAIRDGSLPIDPAEMLQLLQHLSDEELNEMVAAQEELEKRLAEQGPQTDDELHDWIRFELGMNIPRVSVCPTHDPPFKFIADIYFERVNAVLAMGNRGGGKTMLVAILHWINSLFKPGCESCTFGATEAQSLRCYAHLKGWIYDKKGDKKPIIVSSLMRETAFSNGSVVEVLPGTPAAVNGPHPQKAHADEIELMDGGTWKESQPIDTLIATPQGWRRMGDLRIGDYVFGRDGNPTRVIKIRDYGQEQVYRVELTDGRTTECCADHLWTVAGMIQRRRDIWKVMRTSDIIGSGLRTSSGFRFAIPQAKAVDFEIEDHLPIHPYVLGVLLGDGYIGGDAPQFRSEDQEIVDRVNELLGEGHFISTAANGVHGIRRAYSECGFKTFLQESGIEKANSFTKFIPDRYKFASRQSRLEILRGLMDTDGCALDGNSVAQFASVSERLSKDLREIVFSLGGRAILRQKNFKSYWSSGVLYTLDISFNDGTIPFYLRRKVTKMVSRQRTLDPSIKSIEPSRQVKVRCIGVDNADSTYLTENYIVTHNSRNMTMSKVLPNGTTIPPQDICTSTRKGPNGRMQELINEIIDAVRYGFKPPRTLYQWCIKETASQVPNCQVANPDLGEEDKCQCHLVRKGEWAEKDDEGRPRPRLLRDICGGDFYKSRGWQPFADVIKQFTENDQETFEVQQLCLKPEMQWHYMPTFAEETHCIRNYEADPRNGPIFTSTDWGGCYDGETEVLTARGWIPWPEVDDDDRFASLDLETHKVEFQFANSIIRKPFHGYMHRYKNRSIDLLVTADHNMLVAPLDKRRGDKWELTPSLEVPDSSRMTRTSAGRNDSGESSFILQGVIDGAGRCYDDLEIDADDWAAIFGFWMAEGHTEIDTKPLLSGGQRVTGRVGFTHYSKGNISEIKSILRKYFEVHDGIDFNTKRGQLRINDPRLYSYLSMFGKAGDKYLPSHVKRWSSRLLRIYLDWHHRGDGSTDNGDGRIHSVRIYTGSKKLADDLQEIAMYSGIAATIYKRDPRDSVIDGREIKASLSQYCVFIHTVPLRCGSVSEITPSEWGNGMVYCAELPKHHTLYVRRNGKAVWCGNTNPHAVNWYQLLKFQIEAELWIQEGGASTLFRIPEGAIIGFDEIYKAEIGNDRLGHLVKFKEAAYRRKWGPAWVVKERFADPQGKAARLDWKNIGLRTSWHITREFEEHVKVIKDLMDDDLIFIDGGKCPMWVREAKEWRRNPNTGQQIDVFNHAMSNFRYAVANIVKLYKRTRAVSEVPVATPYKRETAVTVTIRKEPPGPIGFSSASNDEFSSWRQSLGQPIRPEFG